jgi:integrase
LRPEELHGLRPKDVDLDTKRLTVNQMLPNTRRKKGEDVPRFMFGPPKTDKSRRMIDFPEFVRELLIEERRHLMENRALAGANWKENGLMFPSEIGTPLEERNVLRRFQKICEDNGRPKLRLYDRRHTHASLLIHEGAHPKKISERLAGVHRERIHSNNAEVGKSRPANGLGCGIIVRMCITPFWWVIRHKSRPVSEDKGAAFVFLQRSQVNSR